MDPKPTPGVTIQPSSEERAETIDILGGPDAELPPRQRDPIPEQFPGPDTNGEIDPPPPEVPRIRDIPPEPPEGSDLPPDDLPPTTPM